MKSWIARLIAFVSLVSLLVACRPSPAESPTANIMPAPLATITPKLPVLTRMPTPLPPIIDTPSTEATASASGKAITPDTVGEVERLVTLTAHTGRVTQVLFSPDGTYLASAGLDRKIRLWNVRTWQEVHTFDIRMVDLNSMAFSPDSTLLASAIAIWDIQTGQVVHEINPRIREVGHVAFSTDGSLLAVASFGPSIKLWEVNSGQVVRNFDMPEVMGFFSVAFSPDGKQLAAGTPQLGRVTLWDVESGQITGALEVGDKSDMHDIEYSPDGKLMVGGGTGYSVGVWEVTSGKLVDQLPLNNGIYGLTFSPDGKILALASCNRVAQLWDVATGRALRNLRHADELMSVAFSPDGSMLATGGYDNKVVVWGIP